MGKRLMDLLLSMLGMCLFLLPGLLIALLIRFSSTGPAIHWSKRIGVRNTTFLMPKFRTMVTETPDIATEKLENPHNYVTPLGAILRKTSIDEIPQLLSVFIGHMSIVGPRPALFNQYELIQKRAETGVSDLKPGITGWAQVNGRDLIDENLKLKFDIEYLDRPSLLFDLKIIALTLAVIFQSRKVRH